jgi:TP901 family phage tail tape measure protein
MAYDLNMQINLQLSPGNVAAIKKSIESSLSNLKIGGVDAKSFSKVNAQISETTKRLNTGQKAAKDFAETLEFKARSFAAYTIASTAILKLTGAISQATREAIKFEKELINISQTTGDSIQATKEQAKVLINISKQYNVSISKVAQLTRTIAQAGFSFRDAAKGAEILARTSLLAGFDSLSSTTEGLIAVMQTFNLTMDETGKVLEKINIVSKKFAVESGDIVEAIKRTGGAFSSAGGSIEELIALFTSVRATTRESAETIATGFRTIFARLQRPKTIEYFKQLGIALEDAQGQFIGPLKAIELIGKRLEELGIRAGSVKFAEVVEQIGGIRQISKVIPLLEQYGDTQKALAIQNQAGVDSLDDVKKAQQGLGFQIGALQQQFVELVQDVVNSKSFKVLAETFITVSRAVLTLTKSLEPLLPLLTAILTVKIGRGITKFLSGGFSLKGMKEAAGFASGGLVPGSGNRDTVPAMLTPGEFVIRKSAVNAVGVSSLANINKYANGGYVKQNLRGINNQTLSWADTDQVSDLSTSAKGSVKGVLFERFLRKRLGRPLGVDTYPDFQDLSMGEKTKLGVPLRYKNAEAKLNKTGGKPTKDTAIVYAYAKGGAVGTDTVPAMLTPGEFVVNKKSAQAFGYGNLKQINKYAKGGTVGKGGDSGPGQSFFGSIISSITGMFKSTKVDTSSIEKDLQRGTGEVIQSMDQFKQELFNVIKDLGQAGVEVAQTFKYAKDVGKSKDGKPRRGSFDPNAKQIRVTMGKGTQSTVAHEAGHAVDYRAGGMKGYASEKEGTLQNTLAKMAQDQIKQALIAKGASEDDIKYRTDLKELFADLFEKSDPAVRKILANTISAEKGMHQLSQLMITEPEKYKRLYGDIQDGIMKTAQYEQARAVQAALAAKEAEKAAKAAKEPSAPAGLTKRALRKEAVTGGLGGLEKRIATEKDPAEKQKLIEEARKMKAEQRASLKGGDLTERTKAAEKQIKAEEDPKKQAALREKLDKQIKDYAAGGFARFDKKANDVAKNLDSMKQATQGFKTSILEMVFYASNAASQLKNFAGIEINQQAVEAANVKALRFGGGAEILGKVNTENVNKLVNGLGNAGKYLDQFGGKLGNKFGPLVQKVGGGLGQLGTTLASNAPKIIAGAKFLAKGFNIAAWVELFGGLVDGLMSVNYEELKNAAIERGDIESAGANALSQYNQELFRGIPLIGGFLSAFQEYMPSTGALSTNQQLVVSTSQLKASMVALDKKVKDSQTAFDEAAAIGDTGGMAKAMGNRRAANEDFRERIQSATELTKGAKGPTAVDVVAGGAAGAAGYGAAGLGVGGLIGGAIGGVVGAVGGGGVGAIPGAVIGAKIGASITAIGGAIFGAAKGATGVISGSTKYVQESFAAIGDSWTKYGKEEADRISQVGGALSGVAVQSIKAGAGVDRALADMKERMGQAAFDDLFQGEEASAAGLENAIKKQKESIETNKEAVLAKDKEIEAAKKAVDGAWFKGGEKKKLAQLEAEKKALEATGEVTEARRKELQQMQIQINQEAALAKQRDIETAAIRKQIEASRAMNKAFDSINKGFRDLTNMEDEISKIGTGQLTKQQAMDATGMTAAGISRDTLAMSSEEILRNPAAMQEMTGSVARMSEAQGIGNALTETVQQTAKNLDLVDQMEKAIMDPLKPLGGDIVKIRQDAVDEAAKSLESSDGKGGKTAGTIIADKIEAQLKANDKNLIIDERLKAALQEYGNDIADNMSAEEASEKLKQKIGEQGAQIIEKQQAALNELAEKQQKLREYEIELVNKRMELAQKAYDVEKDYFEKRNNLNNKIRDLLEPIPTGPGAAGAIQNRAAADRATARAGLANRRANMFQQGGMGGQTLGGAVQSFTNEVKTLQQSTGDVGTAFQALSGQSNLLLATIQDEIQVEEQYLDSLIDSAKAQQDYTQSLYNAQGGLVRKLTFGTDEQRADLLRGLNATVVAAQTGNINAIPEDQRAAVEQISQDFFDLEIPGLGGMKGKDIQRQLAKSQMMQMGASEAEAEQLASKMVEDKVPIDVKMAKQIEDQKKVLEDLYNAEHVVKQGQLDMERKNTETFAASVDVFRQSVNAQAEKLGFKPVPAQAMAGPAGAAAAANPANAPMAPQTIAQSAMNYGQAVLTGNANPITDAASFGGTLTNTLGKMFGGMIPAAPLNAPQAQQITPATAGQQANSQPIQVQTQGQQEITVRLPDIQALVNQSITAMIFETVGSTFNTIAEGVRTANNFEDAANAIVQAATQTTTQNMEGQA